MPGRKEPTVDLGLEGRRAIVRGGTRGIGAIVEMLAAGGTAVGFYARTEPVRTSSSTAR